MESGEEAEGRISLHLTSLHKQPLIVLPVVLRDHMESMANYAMHMSPPASVPRAVSEAVVGANVKPLSDFT
jgi:hypothetical protein